MVQALRTSWNLLEPHNHRDSKVCRVLPHEFGVVCLYRTFSNYIFTGEARMQMVQGTSNHTSIQEKQGAGCLCTCSGWFKSIEPHQTFSNHIRTEIAGRVEFIHMSSGWFDSTEPSLTTSLQGKQREFFHMSSGWFDCTEPSLTTSLQGKQGAAGCSCTSSGWFKRIEPPRIFSNHSIAEIARCVEFFHRRSGWFDCTEPHSSAWQLYC